MSIHAISYGGGVQSTAMIVLAVQGKIRADIALFANVGDDSEHPATLSFVREVMFPWCDQHGFRVEELYRRRKDGSRYESIYESQTRAGSKRVIIPAFMEGGVPTSRVCTSDWKIGTVRRRLQELGASKADPATVLIGISVDEIERANGRSDHASQRVTYPLLDLGLRRSDCEQVIRDAGLPVPPKSSCFFCPYHRATVWAELRRDEPRLFERAQELEDATNQRRRDLNLTPVYLTRYGKRLTDAIPEAQASLFSHEGPGQDGCDSGYCWV